MAPLILRPGESLPTLNGLKAASEHTKGAYAIIEVRLSSGAGPAPHIHEAEEEAFYVLEGEEVFRIGTEEITLGVGGFALVPRGTVHTHSNRGDRPSRTLVIFSPSGMERFFAERAALQARGGSADELAALRERYHVRQHSDDAAH
jgi:quercetin dioxygenase-like cupin family protein